MTIHDIENLSYEELKSRRAELILEAGHLTARELATRYIQARTDAKARDKSLQRMGAAINDLNAQVMSMAEQLAQRMEAAAALQVPAPTPAEKKKKSWFSRFLH